MEDYTCWVKHREQESGSGAQNQEDEDHEHESGSAAPPSGSPLPSPSPTPSSTEPGANPKPASAAVDLLHTVLAPVLATTASTSPAVPEHAHRLTSSSAADEDRLKRAAFKNMGNSWKNFKSRMVSEYVLNPATLEPFGTFPFITRTVWE
uniref:Uncharacterized protein n=1 Tax=Oryza sativa subsp. japonica TaxID=39947 RepID=Q8H2Q7_ORYSJ|nr:hypothetical protein [Oryza sativa Japonica Group]BAD31500.1 hypothetical protein [Oryza sativa Japonica Group]